MKTKTQIEDRWRQSFVGRYFTLEDAMTKSKQRMRIKKVLDENPSDRSVGIFFGCLTVEGTDGNVYDLVTDGTVTLWTDPEDWNAGQTEVGTHKLYTE